ncbi:hypothetical protein LCL61_26535 [Amycolatopsis coloradensis]|uniref:Uncharacterized protein n=1 Tax=Amycolatopsis coloradensis TaxID=76021 RepID=A0ACD5BI80_9PSEU
MAGSGAGGCLDGHGDGTVFDLARRAGFPEFPWLALTVIGALCAWGLRGLDRSRLQTSVVQ